VFTITDTGIYSIAYRLSGVIANEPVTSAIAFNHSSVGSTGVDIPAGEQMDASGSVVVKLAPGINVSLDLYCSAIATLTGASAFMVIQRLS
jgi:hypothetical protein